MHTKYLKLMLLGLGLILFSNVQAESLVYAAYQGNIEVVKFRLESGDDINRLQGMQNERASALHFAVRGNHPEIARLLIEQGARVDIRDVNDLTPLHNAAWSGDMQMVKLLIESGADIRATSNDGSTPLSCAQNANQYDIANFIKARLASNSE
jgi:ankyrin repeat protein